MNMPPSPNSDIQKKTNKDNYGILKYRYFPDKMFQMNLFKQIKKMDKLICFFKLSFVGIKVNETCANVQNECIENAVCDKNRKCQCKVGYTYKNKSCKYSETIMIEHIYSAICSLYRQLEQVIFSGKFVNIWSVHRII